MKSILAFLAALSLLVSMSGCDRLRGVASCGYTVAVRLGDSVHCDSVTLRVVDDDYRCLRTCGVAHCTGQAMTFTGQVDGQRVAFLTFDTLSALFYFVLEPGRTAITINRHNWQLAGGRGNADYVRLLVERQRLLDERQRVWEGYRQAVADTTLTLRGERQAALADSLLADSLQRLLLHAMQRRDPVGRIVRERFIATLTPAALRELQ